MRGYRGSQENTKEVTECYWLKGATRCTGGYRVLGISGWFYLFWNYCLLFSILVTKHFFF